MESLQEIVLCDIKSEIHRLYDTENIQYNCKEEPDECIINFFSYLYKLIPMLERKVHYSQELKSKINSKEISSEHIDILKKFEEAFCKGKDMNGFLSNKIKKSNNTDFLLFAWHIYHLHMSNKFVDRKKMKNNRSDTQLLCIIKQKDVYFIDLMPHPQKPEEYFDIKNLRILVNNRWMEKIGFFEMKEMIPGSLELKIEDSKDLFQLYSQCSVNLAFEFEGKGYSPLRPIMLNRRPYESLEIITQIRKTIKKIEEIEGSYLGFYLESNRVGSVSGLIKFRTKAGKICGQNIFS